MPRGVTDRRVRTARIDQNYRAVLFALPQGMFVLAAIKPHDDAYAFAETVQLHINPANGAMEVVAERAIQRSVETFKATPQPDELPQLLPFQVAELIELGIRADVAEQAIRVRSEDALLVLVEDLPEWQGQALLDLSCGSSLETVRTDYGVGAVATDDPEEALARAVSRMTFVRIDGADELRRMVEGDFEEWRTFLHPTQRGLVERPVYNGPFRLAGGAGTGKTVVALHRAAALAREPGARVLLCTFNRTLATGLQAQLRRLAAPEVVARVDVLGVDQAVYKAVRAQDKHVPRAVDNHTRERTWSDARDAVALPVELRATLSVEFLDAELRAIVLGMPELTEEQYLKVKRPGRGVRLDRLQRISVWKVITEFRRALAAEHSTTFELLAARAAEVAEPSYDHVVVDEGQDLHAAHWRFLRAVVAPGPNDLFLCEDAHQRIYGERIVLSRYGIETRGRSRRLTLNYRSSRQNLTFALGVISGAEVVDSDGDAETVAGYRSAFNGPTPHTHSFPAPEDESTFLVSTVAGWLSAGVAAASIGVLVRTSSHSERARQALQAAGVAVEVLSLNSPSKRDAVAIATMHRSKGMEFSRVVVFGAEAGVVPLKFLVDQVAVEDQPAVRGRERSLLYVACSRARDELVVTWAGAPSPFLPVAG